MNTLDELLEKGQALAQARAEKEAAEAKELEFSRQTTLVQVQIDALSLLKRYVGAVFDELNIGEEWDVQTFYKPPIAKLRLKFNLSFVAQGNEAHLLFEHDKKLMFPCSPEELAIFVFESKLTIDMNRAQNRKRLEELTAEKILDINRGGDEWEGPAQIYRSLDWQLKEYTDLLEQLNQAMENWYFRQAMAEAERQEAAEHQADVQSKVWFDFAVWELKYACKATIGEEEDGEETMYTETAYTLAPEPDMDGDWPIVKYGGRVVNKKFFNLLSREEVPVTNWEDSVAKAVCRREMIDGAKVMLPPEGAVMLNDDLPEMGEGLQVSLKVSL